VSVTVSILWRTGTKRDVAYKFKGRDRNPESTNNRRNFVSCLLEKSLQLLPPCACPILRLNTPNTPFIDLSVRWILTISTHNAKVIVTTYYSYRVSGPKYSWSTWVRDSRCDFIQSYLNRWTHFQCILIGRCTWNFQLCFCKWPESDNLRCSRHTRRRLHILSIEKCIFAKQKRILMNLL